MGAIESRDKPIFSTSFFIRNHINSLPPLNQQDLLGLIFGAWVFQCLNQIAAADEADDFFEGNIVIFLDLLVFLRVPFEIHASEYTHYAYRA
jgi:hypothetical protein